MATTQMVSNPTKVAPDPVRTAGTAGALRLATVWVDLKPERVQDSVAVDVAATVSLGLAIEQPQTVIFVLSGAGLAVTFGSPIGNAVGNSINSGTAARAA
jgi:hypothetical protein